MTRELRWMVLFLIAMTVLSFTMGAGSAFVFEVLRPEATR